jgi:hypothetical protein
MEHVKLKLTLVRREAVCLQRVPVAGAANPSIGIVSLGKVPPELAFCPACGTMLGHRRGDWPGAAVVTIQVHEVSFL